MSCPASAARAVPPAPAGGPAVDQCRGLDVEQVIRPDAELLCRAPGRMPSRKTSARSISRSSTGAARGSAAGRSRYRDAPGCGGRPSSGSPMKRSGPPRTVHLGHPGRRGRRAASPPKGTGPRLARHTTFIVSRAPASPPPAAAAAGAAAVPGGGKGRRVEGGGGEEGAEEGALGSRWPRSPVLPDRVTALAEGERRPRAASCEANTGSR